MLLVLAAVTIPLVAGSGRSSSSKHPNNNPVKPHVAKAPSTSDTLISSMGSQNTGQATFYGGNTAGGACLFSDYSIPTATDGSTLYGTAISDSNWAGSEACGGCVKVTGPSGNIIQAMVVDECPGCGQNHLDLFPDAFAKLADPSKGVIPISWSWISCPIDAKITVRTKSGSSKDWLSVQALNTKDRVSMMEFSSDGSTWTQGTRMDYNHFNIPSGTHSDQVDVRIKTVAGESIELDGLQCQGDATLQSASGTGH